VRAFQAIASAPNTRLVVVPMESSALAGGIAQAMELLRGNDGGPPGLTPGTPPAPEPPSGPILPPPMPPASSLPSAPGSPWGTGTTA
jgi:hypothetical protein